MSVSSAAPRRTGPLRSLRRPLRPRNADARPAAAHRTLRAGPRTIRSSRSSFDYYLAHYVGRPSPLYFAERLTKEAGGARIYLKREDLNHTGAHKINNCIGQALLTRRMGKPRIIAETGAGQHGVATATAAALFGLRVPGLHGRGGRAPAEAQRLQDAGPGHRGGHASPAAAGPCATPSTRPCATGWPRVETHALHHRQRRRPAPVPDDGPRFPVGHRPRDAAAVPGTDRPAARRGRRLRRRRQQLGRHVLPVRRRRRGRAGRRRGRRPRPQRGRARRHARATASPACCTAPSATSCRTTTARRRRSIRSRPASIIPASAPSTATGRTPAASATPASATTRPWRRSHLCSRLEGILPALETAHAVVEAMRIAASAAEGRRGGGLLLRPRRQGLLRGGAAARARRSD